MHVKNQLCFMGAAKEYYKTFKTQIPSLKFQEVSLLSHAPDSKTIESILLGIWVLGLKKLIHIFFRLIKWNDQVMCIASKKKNFLLT
jgi:hypothetical protein